ncbi:hypothetical protein QMP26_05235 [Enterocloster clostridioformis]|uniref:hypothetical protein n=1 Tax=Enterocloster clostridioformis TaxID=1531 RepID=UPI002674CB9C|nr:hypothetical protein [Enterocloster clostridioformis]
METRDLKMMRILSTIPMNSIDESTNLPQSMGSGCFVNYKGCLIFLTVLHNVRAETNITHGIVVDYNLEKGTCLCQFNDFCLCAIGSVSNKTIDIVDFAMKKFDVPMPPCRYLINSGINGDFKRIDRISLTSDFSILPATHEEYGFCGLIKGKLNKTETSLNLHSELAYYDNARYLESKDGYHVFSLENKAYTHENFKGTSGAPITDSKGNLVSLVMSGGPSPTNSNEWLIKGVNLSELSIVVDINCGLI